MISEFNFKECVECPYRYRCKIHAITNSAIEFIRGNHIKIRSHVDLKPVLEKATCVKIIDCSGAFNYTHHISFKDNLYDVIIKKLKDSRKVKK